MTHIAVDDCGIRMQAHGLVNKKKTYLIDQPQRIPINHADTKT